MSPEPSTQGELYSTGLLAKQLPSLAGHLSSLSGSCLLTIDILLQKAVGGEGQWVLTCDSNHPSKPTVCILP